MILSFKKQFPWGSPTNFKQKILDGVKIHTIRDDFHLRWAPGKKIHAAHGVRTKNYDCFFESVCVSVQPVHVRYFESKRYPGEMEIPPERRIIVGGLVLNQKMEEQIAKNDGFDSVDDFFRWFNSDFFGRIIHWTDFQYRV